MADSYSSYMQPFFDTLHQGVQVAQSLRQAALQQQELQQAHDQFQQDMALRQQEFGANQQSARYNAIAGGATPVDASGNVNVPAPVPQSSVGTMQLPGAAPGQLATQAPQLLTSLNSATGATANVPADPGRATVQMGGQTFQPPTPQDQTQNAVARQSALEQADRIPISDKLADAIGIPHGTKISPEHMAGFGSLARWMTPPAQQDNSPSPWKSEVLTDDKGNANNIVTYTDGSTKVNPISAKGRSDKFANPSDAGAAAGAKALTANGRMTAANQAMNNFHKFEADEMSGRQTLDRIDAAIKSGGKYTVKVDDKGNSSLVKVDDSKEPDVPTILSDLQAQRNNVGARLTQVLNNKYDAGDQYTQITTGKPAAWGMSRQNAQSDLQKRLYGAAPPPGAPGTQPAAPQQPAAKTAAPQPTQPQGPPKALLKPGVITTFKNGQQWKLDGQGNPIQVTQSSQGK